MSEERKKGHTKTARDFAVKNNFQILFVILGTDSILTMKTKLIRNPKNHQSFIFWVALLFWQPTKNLIYFCLKCRKKHKCENLHSKPKLRIWFGNCLGKPRPGRNFGSFSCWFLANFVPKSEKIILIIQKTGNYRSHAITCSCPKKLACKYFSDILL